MRKLKELRDTLEYYLKKSDDIRESTEEKDEVQFRLGYEYGLKVALAVIDRIEPSMRQSGYESIQKE